MWQVSILVLLCNKHRRMKSGNALKKVSLELFYKLNDGVAIKSVEIPRTFITQTGKNEENLALHS